MERLVLSISGNTMRLSHKRIESGVILPFR